VVVVVVVVMMMMNKKKKMMMMMMITHWYSVISQNSGFLGDTALKPSKPATLQ